MVGQTKIETLGQEQPAIRQRVEGLFEQGKTLRAIRDTLARDFGVRLSHEAVRHYRQKWEAEREEQEELARERRALDEIAAARPQAARAVALLRHILAIKRALCRG